ncbi:uncharacterized protein LOC128552228, partial [Mercenaria mercenaria]|uniref:uncharacterized protein LOC128552228 n=1 Tax=Mercenaria mercenaria TaxID=6596 RepID=UPI00234E8BFB
ECSPGTYLSERKCIPCPKGQFQRLTGQTTCVKCPSGRTTENVGSVYPEECLQTRFEVTTDKGSNSDASLSEKYIAVIVSSLVTVIVGVPGFLGCYWKIKKNREEEEINRKKREEEEINRKSREEEEINRNDLQQSNPRYQRMSI